MRFRIKERKHNGFYYFTAFDELDVCIGQLSMDIRNAEYGRFSEQCIGDKIAKIVIVSTNIDYCNKGVATSLFNAAIERFKDWNLYLNIVPLPRLGENIKYRTVSGLRDFYSKFGFEYCTNSYPPTMFRKANKVG